MYFGGGATKGVQVNILYWKNYIVYRQICDILKFAHTWVIGEVDSIIKWVLVSTMQEVENSQYLFPSSIFK